MSAIPYLESTIYSMSESLCCQTPYSFTQTLNQVHNAKPASAVPIPAQKLRNDVCCYENQHSSTHPLYVPCCSLKFTEAPETFRLEEYIELEGSNHLLLQQAIIRNAVSSPYPLKPLTSFIKHSHPPFQRLTINIKRSLFGIFSSPVDF